MIEKNRYYDREGKEVKTEASSALKSILLILLIFVCYGIYKYSNLRRTPDGYRIGKETTNGTTVIKKGWFGKVYTYPNNITITQDDWKGGMRKVETTTFQCHTNDASALEFEVNYTIDSNASDKAIKEYRPLIISAMIRGIVISYVLQKSAMQIFVEKHHFTSGCRDTIGSMMDKFQVQLLSLSYKHSQSFLKLIENKRREQIAIEQEDIKLLRLKTDVEMRLAIIEAQEILDEAKLKQEISKLRRKEFHQHIIDSLKSSK